jgi:putative ABC transport system permease protein
MTSWIQTSAKFESGHMKIMSRAYAENADQMPNDLAFIGVNNLLADLKRDFPDLIFARRIKFGRNKGSRPYTRISCGSAF